MGRIAAGTEERTERIAIRMTPTEAGFLADLAKADGLSISDALRLAVRRTHAERFGTGPSVTMAKKAARR